MKKLLSLLLFLLMVFTLIGCDSKKNEELTPTIEEPIVEKQEEEVKQEEPTPEVKVEEPVVEVSTIKEEVKPVISTDPTQYSYWVVVYDQYGNELSRTTAHYGTIVKDPDGKDVKVLTNTYFHTTVNYSSSKKKSGGSSEPQGPTIEMPNKGDLIALNGDITRPYRVLKVDDAQVKLLAMFDYGEIKFNLDPTNNTYAGSNLDRYINLDENGCFYYSLPEAIKNAIVPQNITQKSYVSEPCLAATDNNKIYFETNKPDTSNYRQVTLLSDYKEVGERKVFSLGIEDIIEYFDGNNVISINEILQMFHMTDYSLSLSKNTIWLSSYYDFIEPGFPALDEFNVYTISMSNGIYYFSDPDLPNEVHAVRPAFVIDLAADNVEWSSFVPVS